MADIPRPRTLGSFEHAFARTYAAWERFVSGGDDATDVPRSIALSWHRCRDRYRLDPTQAQPQRAEDDAAAPPLHGRLLTELGGLASTLLAADANRVVTVTDGSGTVVASWGPRTAQPQEPGDLRSMAHWSEPQAGTNAIGTAIIQRRVCSVRGPEHWNQALHSWSCSGIAFTDPLTSAPLATLTVASWREVIPSVRPIDLLLRTGRLCRELHRSAATRQRRIEQAFIDLERSTSGALLACDLTGRVIAANDAARLRGAASGEFMVRPPSASQADPDGLSAALPAIRAHVRRDPEWRGTIAIWSPITDDTETYRLIPVLAGRVPIAILATTDLRTGAGEALRPLDVTPPPSHVPARRVPALGNNGQIVLLDPDSIRHARSDGHAVWLMTDHGPLRATMRGIDQVERDLADLGFIRVHRSYLINLRRIHDITTLRDRLVLSTGNSDRIPVSRRYVPVVRHALNL